MDYKKIRSLSLMFENADWIEFPFNSDMNIIIDNIYHQRYIIRDSDDDLAILETDACKSIKIFIPNYYYKNKTELYKNIFEEKIKDCDITQVELEYYDSYKDNIRVPWNDALDIEYNTFQKNILEDNGIAIYIEEKNKKEVLL